MLEVRMKSTEHSRKNAEDALGESWICPEAARRALCVKEAKDGH